VSRVFGSELGKLLGGAHASQADLHGKSLAAGTKILERAGLTRFEGREGSYDFVDANFVVRAKWIPRSGQEPAHWSKYEPSGNQAHYLNNAGRPVDPTDRAHRIPSDQGSPRGGTGPGSPGPVER
jgi:hypothetical protein